MEFKDEYDEERHYKTLIGHLSKKIGNDLNEYHSTDNLHDWIDCSGRTLLHYSVAYGNAFTTHWLLNYGLDVNAQTKNGKTPLMIAAEHNQENTVKILLKANANVEIVDNNGNSALGYLDFSLRQYSTVPLAIILKLLEKCETEEEAAIKLSNANCPLYAAVLLKNSYITKLLVEKGTDINARGGCSKNTALHLAVHLRDLENVEVLLANGANVNVQNVNGDTPIEVICARNYHRESGNQLGGLKALLGAFIRKNHIDMILRAFDKEVIELVIQAKANLNIKTTWGNAPLHYLAMNSNPGVFETLQNQIIDTSLASDNGYTMLHYAAARGHVSTIQWLLDRGADVNCQNRAGNMPLFYAVMRKSQNIQDLQCVDLLLQYGAEVLVVSDGFEVYEDSGTCIFSGIDLTMIHLALVHEAFDLIQPVLAHLAIIEATGTLIETAIIEAIDLNCRITDSFNEYKQQLEQLKKIEIYESVTMFQLLTVSEKQLLIQLENEQLALKLEQSDYKNNPGVYYRNLRLRVACAYRKLRIQARALKALCKIMQLSYNTHPTITDEICSYLSKQDLILLGQI